MEADLAPNPYLSTHEREVQWVETLPWHLRTIPNSSVDLPGDSAVLHFQGIDTYASVFVNDVLVLSADNAHRTWTTQPFPVTEGGLTIELRFAPLRRADSRRWMPMALWFLQATRPNPSEPKPAP